MIETLLWAPLTFGLVAAILPGRMTGWVAAVGSLVSLAMTIAVVIGFDPSGGLQHTVDASWIPALGVRYQLGVDGISLFLVLLTSILWLAATIWSALNPPERPRLYFLMFGLAETAVLGAFLAQDLILFVLFFDLMLIPFYFLFGSWGTEHPGRPEEDEGPIRPQPATLKMFIYTLVGSLLMLAAAIATGILAANGGAVNFNIQHLAADPLGSGSQYWIFWFFAAAFLVKMPAFPLHGWMPDAYRVAPLPALALFSGVLSKVGAYGFLRVVLPMFPAATTHFQEVILVIAVASILYGSVMAFTQTSARLILGYSSMAQLGFITLGLFSLRADGADGAVLNMVNHGLVVAPLMLIAVLLVERAGTDDIRRMGGLATRAPVLAALFLIATLALLAMPGSANFIGEFYILNGIFQEKIVYAFVAAIGIALAAYYALRLYQAAMHNRKPEGIESREVGLVRGAVLTGLIACIVGLALWPGLILHRADDSVSGQLTRTAQAPTDLAQR
ncbi:MAG TPA: NADH-quinone oxidoreductase subunit M [Solirubrobacterales bacterium]|jgi:NADH-quinone oxidoreductase subunit M|nr:NADH-quinone oxidoreductase subunit M [Solirubrobacterales bacterium]